MKKLNIVAIIPARSGSKGIKDKNIIKFKRKPLLAHSIITAKKCKFDKIIVSTNSTKYRQIAQNFDASVPFLRPKKYSKDHSLDHEYLKHCYNWFLQNKVKIDIFVILRPTTPLRNFKIVNKALNIFIKKKLIYLRSAHEASESPYKWFKRDKHGFYKSVFKNSNLQVTNMTRQSFEKVYIPNGYVDILSTKFFNKKNIFGKKLYVFITERIFEIDTKDDIKILNKC